MDLHPGETIVFEGHPSWRAALSFYVVGLLGAAVIGALAGVILDPTTGALVWLVLFVIVLVVGFVRRIVTTYVITTQRLYIRRGLLVKNIQQTRIDRVQNVNTRQGAFERLLGEIQAAWTNEDVAKLEAAMASIAGQQHRVTASRVPYRSLNQARATCMPDTA